MGVKPAWGTPIYKSQYGKVVVIYYFSLEVGINFPKPEGDNNNFN